MDLYTEIILDHYKNPRNYGSLDNPTFSHVEYNVLCGDRIKFDLFMGNQGKIEKVAFEASGCAISQAAASMLSEKLMGKSIHEVKNISNDEIYAMLNIPISPARVKCALLALMAVRKAISHKL